MKLLRQTSLSTRIGWMTSVLMDKTSLRRWAWIPGRPLFSTQSTSSSGLTETQQACAIFHTAGKSCFWIGILLGHQLLAFTWGSYFSDSRTSKMLFSQFFLYCFMYMVLPSPHLCISQRYQNCVLNLLQLELLMVVSHRVNAGNWTLGL